MEDEKITSLHKVREEKIINQARNLVDNLEEYDEEDFDRMTGEVLKQWHDHRKRYLDQDTKEETGMEKIFTPEEVAEYLKVTPKTIREYLKAGKIRGFKIGNHWRIKQSELEALINQGDEESSQ